MKWKFIRLCAVFFGDIKKWFSYFSAILDENKSMKYMRDLIKFFAVCIGLTYFCIPSLQISYKHVRLLESRGI